MQEAVMTDDKSGVATTVDLPALRDKIDSIDKQLLALISERARCAQTVAEVKVASGVWHLNNPLPWLFSARKAPLLRRLL